MERTEILNRINKLHGELKQLSLLNAELDVLNLKLEQIEQFNIEEIATAPPVLKGNKRTNEQRAFADSLDRKHMYIFTQREHLKKYGMTLTDNLKLTTVDRL